jgi:hypothetical protein
MLEKRPYLDRDAAERLAISALSFLVENPDALARFLALTGIGPADVRRAAADPGFLAGVIDFLLGEETLLIAFAEDAGIPPERIGKAKLVLSPENPAG